MIVKQNGYRYRRAPHHPLAHADGYVAEHRMVLYDAGRLPDPAAEVHHANHDKLDNRLENLLALPSGAHRREHASSDGVTNQHGHFVAVHDRTCDIEGCGRAVESRDWCIVHYSRWMRTGDPLGVRRVTRLTEQPYRLFVT